MIRKCNAETDRPSIQGKMTREQGDGTTGVLDIDEVNGRSFRYNREVSRIDRRDSGSTQTQLLEVSLCVDEKFGQG